MERSSQLEEKLFLEASAGTGKTYTIQHYIVRAILEASLSPVYLLPEEILIVTFTKAASSELQGRVHATLLSAYELLQRLVNEVSSSSITAPLLAGFISESGFEYIHQFLLLHQHEEISSDELKKRVWGLTYALRRCLREIDKIEISTIHSFVDGAITRFQRSCGKLQHSTTASWLSRDGIVEWIHDILAWAIPHGLIMPNEWEILSKRYSSSLLYDFADRLLNHRGQMGESVSSDEDWQALREKSWTTLQKKYAAWKSRTGGDGVGLLEKWLKTKKGTCRKDGTFVATLSSHLHAVLDALENEAQGSWNSVAIPYQEMVCHREAAAKKRPNQELSSSEEARIAEFLESIWTHLQNEVSCDAIYERVYRYLLLMFSRQLQQGVWKSLQSILEDAAVLTYQEESGCAEYLRNRYRVVVVDEFQDTDPLQWSLFQNAFMRERRDGKKTYFLLVGDPKQAIYFFRNADVYTYLKAKEKFASDEVGILKKNYRSSDALVRAINTLFSHGGVDAWLFYMPKIQKSLVCEVVAPCGQVPLLPDNGHRGALHFPIFSGVKGRKRTWPTEDLEAQSIFPWIAQEIVQLIEAGEVTYKDIALLVRDRYQAARFEHFLRRMGLPSKTVRVEEITTSPMFPFFISLLRAVECPYDQARLSQIFLSLKNAVALELLEQLLASSEARACCVDVLVRAKKSFYKGGFGQMMHLLRSEAVWHGMSFLHVAMKSHPDISHNRIDLDHLLEIGAELVARGYALLERLLHAFSRLSSLFSDDPDILLRRADEKENAVNIMTLHRSKGLEFAVVFAVGAMSRTPLNEEDGDAQHPFIFYDREAEKARLLYVALTRAKKRLYVPCAMDASENKISIGTMSPLDIFFGAHRARRRGDALLDGTSWYNAFSQTVSLDELQEILQEIQGIEEAITFSLVESCADEYMPVVNAEEPKNIEAPLRTCALPTERIRYTSFSKMHKPKVAATILQKDPRGRLFGARFHLLISYWIQEMYDPPQFLGSLGAFEGLLEAWIFREFPHWHEMSYRLKEALVASLTARFPLDGECCSLLELRTTTTLMTEQRFLQQQEKSLFMEGAIDLAFVYKQRVYIVDWKTTLCPEEPISLRSHAEQAGYDLQASIYSQIARHYAASVHDISYGGYFLIFTDALVRAKREERSRPIGLFFSEDGVKELQGEMCGRIYASC